jgi:hypothetical protein
MIRDQDVLDPRRVPRYTSPRAARSAPARQRRPLPDRRRPARARHGNGRLVAAGVLVAIAVAGIVTVRSVTRPDFDGAVAADDVVSVVGPRLSVPDEMMPSVPGQVMTLRGLADGAVSLTANGEPVELDSGGGFAVHIPQAWKEVRLVATDAAGDENDQIVAITPTPAQAEHPPTIAVHVRARDWADPEVHDQVIGMIQDGQINAVQLDIKGENGEIGYASKVRLGRRAGTVTEYYDAREAIDELHGLGVRVIGRIVNFLDPLLASWAWENGRPEMIVLDGSGSEPLENNYGAAAFTNFANPQVRQYQIDLAVEAVRLGFDEILYDYIRRPEGDLAAMTFPGLEVPPDVSIARLVADTKTALEGTRALLGVSIFGISASRPEPTAQDVGLLAPLVDYISPMVYPALWNSGEYDVPDPDGQPAEIVSRSLADFERVAAGSGAAIVPWLQAWDYGPSQVHAQIDAALATGSDGYLLWNAASRYDPAMPKPM